MMKPNKSAPEPTGPTGPPQASQASQVAPYRTSDFYLACYLLFLRYPVEAVEPISANRVVFVFRGVQEMVVLDYYNQRRLESISFIEVVEAIKHTKELLYLALERQKKP